MGRKEGGTRGTGWEKRRNMAWWVRGGGRIISDRARLAEFSSMFHPPSAHTLRSLTLSRPQFVCINAQPRDTVRRRNESGRSGKSRGNSTLRSIVERVVGIFATTLSRPLFPLDALIFFFLPRFLWGRDDDQQRGYRIEPRC